MARSTIRVTFLVQKVPTSSGSTAVLKMRMAW